MFNKALFWIFVWFLKTWKKSSPLSEIYFLLNTMLRFHTVLIILRNLSFIFSGNLFLSNNSLHLLNLTQPILILAVTATSQPPLEISLSPK